MGSGRRVPPKPPAGETPVRRDIVYPDGEGPLRPRPRPTPPIDKRKPRDLRELLGPGFVCPDPDMNILMADGSQKKAGDLVIGDLVKTYHEKLLNWEHIKLNLQILLVMLKK